MTCKHFVNLHPKLYLFNNIKDGRLPVKKKRKKMEKKKDKIITETMLALEMSLFRAIIDIYINIQCRNTTKPNCEVKALISLFIVILGYRLAGNIPLPC
jgi:hypothetical protein